MAYPASFSPMLVWPVTPRLALVAVNKSWTWPCVCGGEMGEGGEQKTPEPGLFWEEEEEEEGGSRQRLDLACS